MWLFVMPGGGPSASQRSISAHVAVWMSGGCFLATGSSLCPCSIYFRFGHFFPFLSLASCPSMLLPNSPDAYAPACPAGPQPSPEATAPPEAQDLASPRASGEESARKKTLKAKLPWVSRLTKFGSFYSVWSFVNSPHEGEVEVKEEANQGRESHLASWGEGMLIVSHVRRIAKTQEAILTYQNTVCVYKCHD